MHLLVVGDQHANADTALGVALAHGVNHDDVLRNAQLHGAHVGFSVIDKLAVDFVGEEEKVVLDYDFLDLLQFLGGIYITGGVGRVAEQDGLGAGSDGFFEGFHGRELEAVLDAAGDGFDFQMGRLGEGNVVGVAGFYHDDLVVGVQAGEETQEDGLRAAAGDDDFVGLNVYSIFFIVVDQFFAKPGIAF